MQVGKGAPLMKSDHSSKLSLASPSLSILRIMASNSMSEAPGLPYLKKLPRLSKLIVPALHLSTDS